MSERLSRIDWIGACASLAILAFITTALLKSIDATDFM